jgi:hypothetical protein
MWQIGSINSPVVIDRAVDALVAGLDTPGLRDLAGRSSDENWFEMRELIDETFAELGAPLPQIGTDAPMLLALQFMCERFVAGQITARELAKWAHAHFGHEGPSRAQDLVELDDAIGEAGRAAHITRPVAPREWRRRSAPPSPEQQIP